MKAIHKSGRLRNWPVTSLTCGLPARKRVRYMPRTTRKRFQTRKAAFEDPKHIRELRFSSAEQLNEVQRIIPSKSDEARNQTVDTSDEPRFLLTAIQEELQVIPYEKVEPQDSTINEKVIKMTDHGTRSSFKSHRKPAKEIGSPCH